MGTLSGEDENEAGAEQEVFIKTVTGKIMVVSGL